MGEHAVPLPFPSFINAIKDLPPGSGNYGLISYGGVAFGALKNADLSARMVYDEAERVVTHLQYTLRIKDAVVWGVNTIKLESKMSELQNRLSTPGLELIIDSIGFDFTINTSAIGTKPDLLWGVKPRALNFRPTGGEISWMFDWECEFNISRCADPSALTSPNPPLMAWNYEFTSVINQEGLMERVISGYVQVPAVRGVAPNQNAVLFDVVAAWDSITVNVPNGFRRTNNVHSVNKAKNRVDFSITDTELTSDAYPAGIVEADINYDLSSQGGGLSSWMATLSGELTVAPGYPKSLAAIKYLGILQFLVTKVKALAISSDQKQPAVVPMALRFSYKLFSRTSRFVAGYFFASDATTLLQKSGMWEPIPGTDYQQWAQSMNVAGVWGNHGTSGLKASPSDDSLVTVCIGITTSTITELTAHPYDGSQSPDLSSTLTEIQTTGYASYLSRVVPLMRRDFVIHKYAQQYTPGDASYVDHVTQDRSAPDQYVRMVGHAVRLNAAPEMPKLMTVGGKQVELLHQGGWQDDTPVVESLGHRVYRAHWDNIYRIAGQPIAPPNEPGAMPVASHSQSLPLTGGTVTEIVRQSGEEEQ
jgi:hypothetical protein